MENVQLIGVPTALAALFALLAVAGLRLAARGGKAGRLDRAAFGAGALLLAGAWGFVAVFHAVTG